MGTLSQGIATITAEGVREITGTGSLLANPAVIATGGIFASGTITADIATILARGDVLRYIPIEQGCLNINESDLQTYGKQLYGGINQGIPGTYSHDKIWVEQKQQVTSWDAQTINVSDTRGSCSQIPFRIYGKLLYAGNVNNCTTQFNKLWVPQDKNTDDWDTQAANTSSVRKCNG